MFNLDRKQQVALLVILALLLFGGGYKLATIRNAGGVPAGGEFVDAAGEDNKSGREQQVEKEQEQEKILVHVVGAVENPGVYELPRESRVVDAVEAAVPAGDARLDLLNLAAPLSDGTKVIVVSAEDYKNPLSPGQLPVQGSASLNMYGANSDLININRAGMDRLQELTGIGPALSERIINYREEHGRFLSTEDLKNVSGIGEKRYEQVKDSITVN